MQHTWLFLFACLSAGCTATTVNGPAGRSTNATIGVPGLAAVTTVDDSPASVHDMCMAKYKGYADAKRLCDQETVMTSPMAGVWWCNGYGYSGWYAPPMAQSAQLCNAYGPLPRSKK